MNDEHVENQMQLFSKIDRQMNFFYEKSDKVISSIEYIYEIYREKYARINPQSDAKCLSKRSEYLFNGTDQTS